MKLEQSNRHKKVYEEKNRYLVHRLEFHVLNKTFRFSIFSVTKSQITPSPNTSHQPTTTGHTPHAARICTSHHFAISLQQPDRPHYRMSEPYWVADIMAEISLFTSSPQAIISCLVTATLIAATLRCVFARGCFSKNKRPSALASLQAFTPAEVLKDEVSLAPFNQRSRCNTSHAVFHGRPGGSSG